MNEPLATVLLVEDEPAIAEPLIDFLRDAGYRVLHAADGDRGLELALTADPDVLLLDLMLPKLDGFSVLRRLRADRSTAIVIVLSARGEEFDRVQGFEVGADDYVVKPFSMAELRLRIDALLARSQGAAPRVPLAADKLRLGACEIDFAGYTASRAGGQVGLSRTELELLRALASRPGEVWRRADLFEEVWGIDSATTERTLDTHVLKLRKKLEPEPDRPRHLLTVRGVGYKLML
jgi:DNA-binding response OmpR family regulator